MRYYSLLQDMWNRVSNYACKQCGSLAIVSHEDGFPDVWGCRICNYTTYARDVFFGEVIDVIVLGVILRCVIVAQSKQFVRLMISREEMLEIQAESGDLAENATVEVYHFIPRKYAQSKRFVTAGEFHMPKDKLVEILS
ncbi:MAG: hypothetical protein A3C80_03285 [Candidatus Ryanbacteria bacterium RIFCSPHIGHO2_02_FULL_45_43]|uniref:Uncharacterized protein n=1 Tax=Candidatus Ryanbacteria bacterium RIFCSPHIGHO2_01_45_13 TaxID=1802112 RepID=A0A1G2FUP8_9BACT|nr:MAG: hypothetical protein A2W41_01225 [Candidatus Ryanbacteria bacterium RIFCSPHIGHO2_01_45_13]OGZ47955.1 MAG: hypothetical protein A3C80_03285 [Candidatus Ryanbacteria bacterium RIFCSPHIGHO2_02_FULL_45_43]OGZ51093.1 MAG: hypothetical protein A3A17_03590 [Candidatus Ryanbacteria bacterium RIFCSPLOWO2_01_FULL_44_230]OGZ54683.1 MAG: hypothetical protein A3H62_01105 [Candidatus Ryanbacteria bacterium RIFCSPLOWO2_02_FULL_44_40]